MKLERVGLYGNLWRPDMKVIGGYQHPTRGGLLFASADGKTQVSFVFDENGSLQVELNGEWLWLSPAQVKAIRKWLKSNSGHPLW